MLSRLIRPLLSLRTLIAISLALVLPLGLMPASAVPVKFSPGGSTGGDPYYPDMGNTGYDAFSYAVTLEIAIKGDGSRPVKGESVMTATATQNLSRFSMDLRGLKVSKVTIDGKSVKFSRNATKLFITPKGGIRKGQTFLTQVWYSGRPTKVNSPTGLVEGWLETDDGVVGVGDPNNAATWMPVNDDLGDRSFFSATLRVPDGYFALSNGKTVRPPKMVKGLKEFAWKAAETMTSQNFLVAVGKFDTIGSQALPGVWTYSAIDPTIDADLKASYRTMIGELPKILSFFEQRFGKYPFNSAGAIFDRLDSSFSVDVQTRAFFPDKSVAGENLEDFFVHQMAHAWFGQSISPKSYRDIYLNEAFATYATWLWFDQQKTTEPFSDRIFSQVYANATDDFWNVNISDPGPPKLFDSAIYYRGAMSLHVLRKTLGDTEFFNLLKAWHTKKRYGIATVQEFTDFAVSRSSKDVSLIFRDWVYSTGKPTRTSY
jgi:aminopeptidase N